MYFVQFVCLSFNLGQQSTYFITICLAMRKDRKLVFRCWYYEHVGWVLLFSVYYALINHDPGLRDLHLSNIAGSNE